MSSLLILTVVLSGFSAGTAIIGLLSMLMQSGRRDH